MPYIKSKIDRKILDDVIESYGIFLTEHPGYLNYFLHKLVKVTCKNYEEYRNFEGELIMAFLEIYRRPVAEHEDDAIERNGDVE